MRKKPPLRIPRHLSSAMTYAELERWFEAEFERIRREGAREQKSRFDEQQQTNTNETGNLS